VTLENIVARPSFTNAMKLNTETLQNIAARTSFTNAMKLNNEALAGITGIGRLAETMSANIKAFTEITASTGFLEAMKLNIRPLSDIIAAPQFASMIATPVMPTYDWSRVLEGMQGAIGAAFVDAATAEFDLAAEVVAEPEGDVWWFARLPMMAQFGLLLMVLQVLDKAGEFMGDLTGQDVPPAYRTGVEMLFCLAFALHALIEAKAEVEEDGDEGDRE
jgi:hypothetical protein